MTLSYMASGSIFASFIYMVQESYTKYKIDGKLWNNQNIIIDGKLNNRNLILFIQYFVSFLGIQFLAATTMLFSQKAGINVGVVTII